MTQMPQETWARLKWRLIKYCSVSVCVASSFQLNQSSPSPHTSLLIPSSSKTLPLRRQPDFFHFCFCVFHISSSLKGIEYLASSEVQRLVLVKSISRCHDLYFSLPCYVLVLCCFLLLSLVCILLHSCKLLGGRNS